MQDVLFGLFGSYYSDGTTREDRESRYTREVEKWRGYEPQSGSAPDS